VSPPTDSPLAVSCVVDDTPALWSSLVPWLATALGPGGFAPERVHVQHVCPLRPELEALCGALGVRTRRVERFDARSPHANKIRSCDDDFGDAGRVLLTDVDLVFAARPPAARVAAPVAGKLVDGPNPPLRLLEALFEEAGLPRPPRLAARHPRYGAFETLLGNFNGGLYVVDARALRPLGEGWGRWTRWLLARRERLLRWSVHVDQVAFCLALAESGLAAEALDAAWNFPLHVEAPIAREPFLLHHHSALDEHLRLARPRGGPAAPAVARVNACIEAFLRRHYDPRFFWNHRYAQHPARGSGLGSRGEALAAKRALLSHLTDESKPSVIDFGCGDLEVVRALAWKDYLGVDASEEALRLAREKRPDWRFCTPEELERAPEPPRDLALCLDVLIHQPTRESFRALLDRVLASARRGALVSGYDRAPDAASPITWFHEPLGEALRRDPRVRWAAPLLEYRETTLYFAALGEAPDGGEEDARGDAVPRARRALRGA
jgi:hypothetical protein